MKKILLFGILGALGCLAGGAAGEPVLKSLLDWAKQFDPKVNPINRPQAPLDPPPPPRTAGVAVNPLPPPTPRPALAPPTRTPPVIDPEIERRLQIHKAGTGPVQVALKWDNYNDLDLHVVEPLGEEIYYQHKHSSKTVGFLDVDMNVSDHDSEQPVEHVNYKTEPPEGRYMVYVVYYNTHVSAQSNYEVIVIANGEAKTYRGYFVADAAKESKVLVCEFNVVHTKIDPKIVLTAPGEVQIPAGGSNQFGVNLARIDFDGPVTLGLGSGADGVTLDSSPIPGGVKNGLGTLRANLSAVGGPRSTELVASANVGGNTIESRVPISLNVLVPPKPDPVLKLSLPEAVQVYPNNKNTFTIKVGRFNFPDTTPVMVKMAGGAGGVLSQPDIAIEPVELGAGIKEAQLTVTATNGALPGTRQVHFTADADASGVHVNADGFMTVEIVALPSPPPIWPGAVVMGAWTSLLAFGLALLLTMGHNRAVRGPLLRPNQVGPLLFGSALAGGLAGGGGQSLSELLKRSPTLPIPLWAGQFAGWLLLGLLLGWVLAGFFPNPPKFRIALAGGVGGLVGAGALLTLTHSHGETVGRVAGAAILGFAIGCMVAFIVDIFTGEAWLDVTYRPNATEKINLGQKPVIFGSDWRACTITVKGAAPVAFRYELGSGGILCTDVVANKTSTVALDSSRQIGTVQVTVRGVTGKASKTSKSSKGPVAAGIPTGFSLQLSKGRNITLTDGLELTASHLPGLKAASGKTVALVTRTPKNPAVVVLQNLSTRAWGASFTGGSTGQVQPTQKIQLIKGCNFDFGSVQGKVQ